MNIVFMGTPQFAVPALEALIQSSHTVQAVFCQPDRPRGRSKKLCACPVKETALKAELPIFQPEKIRLRTWRRVLEDFQADVFVVAAYGQILSQKIIDAPRIDCINLHASLLPRWRGASPIHSALLHGDPETGISLMRIEKELDAGPVYQRVKTIIQPDETRIELEHRLAQLGADMLLKELPLLAHKEPIPQHPPEEICFSPIIVKKDGYFKMTESAIAVERKLRAIGDWPGLWCKFRGTPLKIVKARSVTSAEMPVTQDTTMLPGQLLPLGRKRIFLQMGSSSFLELLEVQPSGKKPQPVHAFINGYHPSPDDCLEEHH